MNFPYRLILGSKSPRRKELLELMGLAIQVEAYPIEENFSHEIPSTEVAEYLAKKKANGFRSLNDQELLITADTVVINNDEVLGKPSNRAEAIRMISELSGRTHVVVSGVCIKTLTKEVSFSASTEVTFNVLDEFEVVHYVDQYKPFDKAGAYGIQEWIGMIGITSIKGDYYNVVGLPISKLYQTLKTEFSA